MTKSIKITLTVVGGISLIFVGLIFWLIFYSPFPNDQEIERFLNQVDHQKIERFKNLKDFMLSIRDPESVKQDYAVDKILNRLREIYIRTRDEDILRAIDETPSDGGFRNYICDFYSKILSEERARYHYRLNPNPLKLCIGISFSEDELTAIIK